MCGRVLYVGDPEGGLICTAIMRSSCRLWRAGFSGRALGLGVLLGQISPDERGECEQKEDRQTRDREI